MSKLDYDKNRYVSSWSHYSSEIFYCGICTKEFDPDFISWEYGIRYFPTTSKITGEYICEVCYNNLPKYADNYCWYCNEKFNSGNKLFAHLAQTNHYQSRPLIGNINYLI